MRQEVQEKQGLATSSVNESLLEKLRNSSLSVTMENFQDICLLITEKSLGLADKDVNELIRLSVGDLREPIVQTAFMCGYKFYDFNKPLLENMLKAMMEDYGGDEQEDDLIIKLIKEGVDFDISDLPVMLFYKAVEIGEEEVVKKCMQKCEGNDDKLKELVSFRRNFVSSMMDHKSGQHTIVEFKPGDDELQASRAIGSVLEQAIWSKKDTVVELIWEACSRVASDALSTPNPLSELTPLDLRNKLKKMGNDREMRGSQQIISPF